MLTYVIRRTFQAIPLLGLISMILFLIIHSAPGGGLGPYLQNPHITPADIVRLKHNLGLDRPLPVQYIAWLGEVLRGDFGYSTSNSEPVFNAIVERLPSTLLLMGTAYLIAIVIGVSAGLFAAVRPYTTWDYFITTFAFFGQSMPVFWLALMLQLGFAVHGIPLPFGYLLQLPSAGISSLDTFDCPSFAGPVVSLIFIGGLLWTLATRQARYVGYCSVPLVVALIAGHANLNGLFNLPMLFSTACGQTLGDRATHLILPATVLAFLNIALYSRFMRSSMLEVIKTDYMRTASAKGLSFRTILFKHGLKNALIPLVTVTALTLPGLFGGAIVTESIFAWPGEGRLFINALGQQDIAVLLGFLIVNAFLVVFFNLLADVLYAWLDPRVKYD